MEIIKLADLDHDMQSAAIDVFIDSFYKTYKRVSKDKNKLRAFLLTVFDFQMVYIAIIDKKPVGFLAMSNGKERSMKFHKADCVKTLGRVLGTIAYHQMKYVLGNPNLEHETDIGIDHLATAANCRGKGVASGLIEYACANLCYDQCFLDVASNNTVAMRLYTHLGFREYARESGVVNRMLGFGYIIRMKKRVSR